MMGLKKPSWKMWTRLKRHIRKYPALICLVLLVFAVVTQHFLVQPITINYNSKKQMQPDFALLQNGARVLSTPNTKAVVVDKLTIFGIPVASITSRPELAITSGAKPFEAFCFVGNHGTLVIQLAREVKITSVQIDHLDKEDTLNYRFSAPKHLQVFQSLDNEVYQSIGNFTYDLDDLASQEFPCHNVKNNVSKFIKVQVTSNWGHADYTCVYGIRVHGIPR